jgi:hypothetical protein
MLTANGAAIEGVCVTGEAIRPIVQVLSKDESRWAAGMSCPDEQSETGAQFLQSRRTDEFN